MDRVEECIGRLQEALQAGDADAWNSFVAEAGASPRLAGISLAGEDLRGYSFQGCTLDGANLSSCRLQEVCFRSASLVAASLIGADLRGADLAHAVAREVDLRGAHLDGADLTWCDLRRAKLERVDLSTATLWKTDLRGAVYPRFRPNSQQDFMSGPSDATAEICLTMPLSDLLRRVSAVDGIPYRWRGTTEPPEVLMPGPEEDPRPHLRRMMARHHLKMEPVHGRSGDLRYYAVLPAAER